MSSDNAGSTYLIVGQGSHDDVVKTEVKRLVEQNDDAGTLGLCRLVRALRDDESRGRSSTAIRQRAFSNIHEVISGSSAASLRQPAKRELLVWAIGQALRIDGRDKFVDQRTHDDLVTFLAQGMGWATKLDAGDLASTARHDR
jgi:hypothetical protein